MVAPVNNNVSNRPLNVNGKKVEKKVHATIEREMKSLDYANKKLVEDMILSYINGDPSFNGHKTVFTRRIKYLSLRLKDPRSSGEALHLTSQFILLDRVRRSFGIPLKDVRIAGRTPLQPSALPKGIIDLLNVPSSSGTDYLKYVKNNVEMVIFANFGSTKELREYGDNAGVSDPISRTALINSITYYGPDETPALYWAMASSLVHEAAHIEWDWLNDKDPADVSSDFAAERHSYIMKYDFLNDILANLGCYKLEKHRKVIEATMGQIESVIIEFNKRLGYKAGDFSLKISSK